MNHGQNLRDLLEPLGVYRWEGSFQWGELQSEGAALDGVADALASLQQEMNLTTAQGEGLDRVLELLGRERDQEDPETLRETLAALLRIGNGAFTLAAMNDALRGCGIPAVVEETETKQVRCPFRGSWGCRRTSQGGRNGWRPSCPATFRWSIALRKQQEKVCEGALCRTIKFKKFFRGPGKTVVSGGCEIGKNS